MGCGRSTLFLWESDKQKPSLKSIKRLSEYYNLAYDDIYKEYYPHGEEQTIKETKSLFMEQPLAPTDNQNNTLLTTNAEFKSILKEYIKQTDKLFGNLQNANLEELEIIKKINNVFIDRLDALTQLKEKEKLWNSFSE